MAFKTSNKYVVWLFRFIYRKRLKRLAFSFSSEQIDDDVPYWSFKKQYIIELRERVDAYIKDLEQD